ncbi:MAG: DNA polymerase III subunit beta [Candidatus Colwellbacteria bacterium]|nr:DNA polymerase III subunit beta [Candidatus Colwellbacteria bacterium]
MKLVVLKNNLKLGLDLVGRAVGSALNLPVLGNVLIKSENNKIRLSATNLELAITKNISGKVVEEGGITVPYGLLAGIVAGLSSERVSLETDKKNNLVLKTDNYEAKCEGIDESDFPVIPRTEKKEELIETSAGPLRDALNRVVVAGEISELRPEISGVLFSIETSGLKLVATDSFRLAEAKISSSQIKNKNKQVADLIVPLKTAQELSRSIKEDGGVHIYLNNNQVLFEAEELEIVSRIIEGKFPDYDAIVPKEILTEILVNRSELSGALKLSGLFASRTNEVKLRIKDKKILEVYSADNAVGENNYLLPAKISGETAKGDEPLTVSFNWRYLLDGIRSGESEEVMLGLNGDEKPAVIRTPGDISYFYILMPVKSLAS